MQALHGQGWERLYRTQYHVSLSTPWGWIYEGLWNFGGTHTALPISLNIQPTQGGLKAFVVYKDGVTLDVELRSSPSSIYEFTFKSQVKPLLGSGATAYPTQQTWILGGSWGKRVKYVSVAEPINYDAAQFGVPAPTMEGHVKYEDDTLEKIRMYCANN